MNAANVWKCKLLFGCSIDSFLNDKQKITQTVKIYILNQKLFCVNVLNFSKNVYKAQKLKIINWYKVLSL